MSARKGRRADPARAVDSPTRVTRTPVGGRPGNAVVLHVCSANRCRSPLAELMMRRALGAYDSRVRVGSAGTWTRGGEQMWGPAAEEATRRGLRPVGFVSRPLSPTLVEGADLVLAATRSLRDAVVTQVPSALGKTFTWRELAWLLADVTPELLDGVGLDGAGLDGATVARRLAAVPALARARRGLFAAPEPGALDVDDPVEGPAAALVPAADCIEAALATIVRAVGIPPSG